MTDYPLVQFVSSPDTSAGVRYDFNPSSAAYVGADDFDEGVPTIEGDPGTIGAEPSYRTITFSHHLRGTSADMATAQAGLAQELLRLENWLLFQRSATSEPRWIKTYRRTPGKFDLTGEFKAGISQWTFEVSLDADPYWLGPRETQPTVTVNNDPAVPTSAISTPTLNAPTTAATGGTLAAATYYYKITATTSAGETPASAEKSIATTGTTSTVSLSWPAVPNAAGYNIYRSKTTGTEKLLVTLGNVTSYTDTGSLTPGTTSPPTTNTTAGSNPMWYTLPAIKGDAPAPLVITVYPSAEIYAKTWVSVTSGSSLFSQPFAWQQAAAAGLNTDAGPVASDATFSGGAYVPITFATNTSITAPRLDHVLPSVPANGTYAVFARMARSDATSTFQVQFRSYLNVAGDIVNVTGAGSDGITGRATLVSLGTFFLLSDHPSDTLYAGRLSGSGSLNVDYFFAIPISPSPTSGDDLQTIAIEAENSTTYFGSNGIELFLDGESEVAVDNAYGALYWLTVPLRGAFPVGIPGRANKLTLLLSEGSSFNIGDRFDSVNASDRVALSSTVDINYTPRYLYLANS